MSVSFFYIQDQLHGEVYIGDQCLTYSINQLHFPTRVLVTAPCIDSLVTLQDPELSYIVKNIKKVLEIELENIRKIGRRFDWKPNSSGLGIFNEFTAFLREKNVDCLTSLDLSHLELTSLPHQIGLCQNVETLNISHNKIHLLPPELTLLKNLKVLDISDNPVWDIPDLSSLKYLSKIIANSTNICAIPEWEKQCPSLEFEDSSISSQWAQIKI